jgi:hypothetical protein
VATYARTFAVLALALTAIAAPSSAPADVVRPPATDCPEGEVPGIGHSARCVKKAPEDCPTGWRGAIGGTCRLTPCETNASCSEGESCVEHLVCLAPYLDEFYDHGEEERERHGMLDPGEGALLRSPTLLAAPMMARTRRPKPITRYSAVNVCSPEVACAAPATCQHEKLCVPRGRRAVAYAGSNTAPARVARRTETPLTASAADATAPADSPRDASTDPPPASPKERGCGACAAAPELGGGAGPVLMAAVGLATRRRGARARRARPGAARCHRGVG